MLLVFSGAPPLVSSVAGVKWKDGVVGLRLAPSIPLGATAALTTGSPLSPCASSGHHVFISNIALSVFPII